MLLTPGTRLGPYAIVAPLGAGGMGEVWRAHDPRLGRDVALKVLPAAVAADPARLARFEREARTVASLNHPAIVTLYSVEDADGVRFLTMEVVEGEALDRAVAPGGVPLPRVAELGIAMADALAAAHDKGIVHRDLKPANVMLTRDGRVKVLDFGLATSVAAAAPLDATVAAPLSVAGEIAGTVPYMAPEQLRGEAVDARTDIFALGIVLYELATGARPFTGATAMDVSSAILRDTPPALTSVRLDAPADLARIVTRCLEKSPEARFASARELGEALRTMRHARDAGTVVKLPPVPPTPLLGRETTLAAAAERIRDGARLLTVTGYGGTGKTRFAIELYRRLAAEYAGGAAFVSLASVTAARDVLPAVTTALEIAEAHGRSALDALATVIGERRVLLVLDNLEQVLDSAEDIATLVARCPALQVVATSRAPLKVSAETEFALPPLDLPAAGETALETLRACPSIALFVQRAEKVKPGFALSDANAEAIAAICRRLDGLPLALELAAARVRILDPAALLLRLDHALDLLTSGDRDLPLRQRTLRATISWSYSLLDAAEQRTLLWLSVFHEGWTLDAMEQVCFTDDERWQALDHLDSLVEKGLVRVIDGGARYALLETIRAFAAEQLHAGGRVDAARQAHADYFLAFAAEAAAGLRDSRQLDAMARARGEFANMHAAIHWLTAHARMGDAANLEKGLLLCGHLDWVWHIAALHFTGDALLEPLLALAASAPPSRGRALARLASGMIHTTTGEWERSLRAWSAAHDDGVALADEAIAAEGAMGVGYCHLCVGRLDEADAPLRDAIARSAGGVSDFIHGLAKSVRGMLLFVRGDLAGGIALVEEAWQIHARYDDHELGGVNRSFLAQMTFAQGDHARALAIYVQALALLEGVGDMPEVARVHCEMGWVALTAGDAPAARTSFVQAVRTYELVGSPRGTGLALLGLAAVDAAEGRSERAIAIAAAADALSARAGVVIEHPMDPSVVERIAALKASIPARTLEGLVASAETLTVAAVLGMAAE